MRLAFVILAILGPQYCWAVKCNAHPARRTGLPGNKMISEAVLDVTSSVDPSSGLKHDVAIFGPDQRTPVMPNQISRLPYSSIGILKTSNGTTCCISLVGKRSMVTASHCLYSDINNYAGTRANTGLVRFPNGQSYKVCLAYDANSMRVRGNRTKTQLNANDVAIMRIAGDAVPGLPPLTLGHRNADDLTAMYNQRGQNGRSFVKATFPQWDRSSGGSYEYKEHVYNGTPNSCHVHGSYGPNRAATSCHANVGQSGCPLIIEDKPPGSPSAVPTIAGIMSSVRSKHQYLDQYSVYDANEFLVLGPHTQAISKAISEADKNSSPNCSNPDGPSPISLNDDQDDNAFVVAPKQTLTQEL